MPTVPRPRVGYALVAAAALLFAVNGSVSRVVLVAGIPAQRLTELRATGTSLGLALALLVVAPHSLRIGWRDLPFLAVYGVAGGALQPWLYLEAIHHLPVSIAVLLQYTAPVFVAAWVRFVLGKPVRRRFWAGLGLSLAGLALVVQVWRGMALDPVGVVAGFGAAVGVASYYLLGERGLAARDPLPLTCWMFFFGALFWGLALPWWTLDTSAFADTPSLLGSLADVTAPVWVLVLWIVVLGTITPYALTLSALRHLPATRVSVVAMLEPVGAAAVAWLWLGEALSLLQLAGAATVLAGIVAAQTSRINDERDAGSPA
jgi:drug/metabolite transporter (DMT)-like permease